MRDRLFVHLTWTTRDRARLIDAPLADFLVRLFPVTCRQERARLLEIGIVQTHLHLLVRLHPTTTIPRLLQRLKGASAVLARRAGLPETSRTLRWDKGYDIESVSPRAADRVRRYIQAQPQRHPDQVIPGWSPGKLSEEELAPAE